MNGLDQVASQKIKLGKGPYFLAEDSCGNRLFISNNRSNEIFEVDPLRAKIVSKIKIERPRNLVFDHIHNKLFVIYGKSNWIRFYQRGKFLSIIDASSKSIIKTIGNNNGFSGIDINTETGIVYAVQANPKQIIQIDSSSDEIIKMIKIKENPNGIFFNSKTNTAIIEKKGVNSISTYDLQNGRRIRKIKFKQKGKTKQLVFDPDFNRIYLRKHDSWYNEGAGGFWETGYVLNYFNEKTTFTTKEANNSYLVLSNVTKMGVFFCQKEDNEIIIHDGVKLFKKFQLDHNIEFLRINLESNKIYILAGDFLENYLYIMDR